MIGPLPAPQTMLVRAYCPLGHSWVTMATVALSRPPGLRHPIVHESLEEPYCDRCAGRYVRFQDTRHAYTPFP